MKKKALIGTIFALLASCSNAEAETAVKDLLVDPESAQFSDVAVKNGVTCGFVNSKNRMGGYVGRTAFLYENGFARLSSPNDADFITQFGTKCPDNLVQRFLQQRLGS